VLAGRVGLAAARGSADIVDFDNPVWPTSMLIFGPPPSF
jgi:hypothetical protein